MDRYANELFEIHRRLKQAGFEPSIRGESAGRFVLVEHQRRAAELSNADEGWFVELWEEPSETSVRDGNHATLSIAVDQVIEWLRNQ